MKKENRLTKIGLISTIYSEQKQSSKARNHPPPSYSKEMLVSWFLKQENFDRLYYLWKISNFNKWSRPSVDRIDNRLPYTLDNIQLTTFKKNNRRSHEDAKNGEFVELRSVDQYDLNLKYLRSFKSISEASRVLGISPNHIVYACNKKKYAPKRWFWKYSEDKELPSYKNRTRSYYQYDSAGNLLFSSSDREELRKYLNKKDLSPLNKAIRKGVDYCGFKWIAE